MNGKNLSIIIPHFNCPDLLEKLLQSIPDKTDIQIIVVDDNSTKCINQFNKVRAKYSDKVEFYTNYTKIQSAGACRNIGIDHAVGKWLLFPDADDYYYPEMYAELCRYFDSDYDLVYFNVKSQFLNTGLDANRHVSREKRIKRYFLNPTNDNLLSLSKATELWGECVRSTVVHNNKIYCSQTRYCNDIMCSRRIAYHSKRVAVIDKPLYCIIDREGSLTKNASTDRFRDFVKEVTKAHLYDRQHYSRYQLSKIDLIGGHRVIDVAFKLHVPAKNILWGISYFIFYRVPLMPSRYYYALFGLCTRGKYGSKKGD